MRAVRSASPTTRAGIAIVPMPDLAKERWVEARRAELLPVGYFHLVFTLPHELNPLCQGNPRVIYDLLFRAMGDTLRCFADDPRHLGGQAGVTAILHTWGQNLSQHIHLHCIVTGGALARDGSRWISANPKFLFPVRALSKVFRGKFLDGLRGAFDGGELAFCGTTRILLRLTRSDPGSAGCAAPPGRILKRPSRPAAGPRVPRPIHPSCRHLQ